MPTATYIALANTTLSSTSTAVTFGSIPASYRDLVVHIQTARSGGLSGLGIQLNSDTGNYTDVKVQGDGSTANTDTQQLTFLNIGATDTNQTAGVIHIMDYSATDKHKTLLARTSVSTFDRTGVGRWASTSAVTSVTVTLGGNSFNSGSTFALYGIVS